MIDFEYEKFEYEDINVFELDSQLSEQASRYGYIVEECAKVTNERDVLKRDLDNYEALADTRLRIDANNRKEKMTEKSIACLITTDKKRIEIETKLLECQSKLSLLVAERQNLENRRKAIEGFISLYIAEYFNDSDSSRISKERVEEYRQAKLEISQRDQLKEAKINRDKIIGKE